MAEPGAAPSRLVLAERSGRTRVVAQHVAWPLAFTRAFHLDERPAGMATVVVQSLAGTLAPGAPVDLAVEAGPGAQVHLTTAGATAAAGGGPARHRLAVVAGRRSLVEVLPGPLLALPGADVRGEVEVTVAPGAVVVLADAVALGDGARVRASVTVRAGGSVACAEHLDLDARSALLGAPGVLAGHRRVASFWVLGVDPRRGGELHQALAAAGGRVGVLPGQAGLLVRLLGGDGPALTAALRRLWVATRTVLAGAPPAPRRVGALSAAPAAAG